MPKREIDLQREERERQKMKAQSRLSLNWSHGGSWCLLMMVTIWQKGWEREKMPERETYLAKGGKRERKNEGLIWWLLVMMTTGVVVATYGGVMNCQWEERALGKRKKNEEGEETKRRTGWSENAKLIFGERHYVMGQVIRVGPILCLILQKCHWNSILKNWKHQNPVFIFHHPHPKFWVFELWKQWFKTKPNRWSSVGSTRFGWWIMKIERYCSVFMLSKHALTS